jgi:SAM-dependent methyltransferase
MGGLDIGSGAFRYKDYTTVDLYAPEADIKADMGALPIESRTIDDIWASHCLEHVMPDRVQAVLTEWLRVLKPGGILKVVVPDLDDACRAWLERRNGALSMLYGSVGPGGPHYHGWGALELRDELMIAGFEVLSIQTFRETAGHNLGGTYFHLMVNLYAEARKHG